MTIHRNTAHIIFPVYLSLKYLQMDLWMPLGRSGKSPHPLNRTLKILSTIKKVMTVASCYTQTSWLWPPSSSSLRIGGRRQAIDYTHTGTLVSPGWIWIMDLSAFCKIRMCCVGSALLNIINLLHGKAWFVKIKRWKTLQVLGKASFSQFNARLHDYHDHYKYGDEVDRICFIHS